MKDHASPQEQSKKCTGCQRVLELGVDVLCIEEGVIGPRGIVPLREVLFFCSDSCVAGYFNGTDVAQLKRRVP